MASWLQRFIGDTRVEMLRLLRRSRQTITSLSDALRLTDNAAPGQGEPTSEGDMVYLKIGSTEVLGSSGIATQQGNIQLHLNCRGPGDPSVLD